MSNTIEVEVFFFSILYPIIIIGIFPQIAWLLAKKLDNQKDIPPLPDPTPAENPFKCVGFWLANSILWFFTLLSVLIGRKSF